MQQTAPNYPGRAVVWTPSVAHHRQGGLGQAQQPLVVLHLSLDQQEFVLRPLHKVVAKEDMMHPLTGKTIKDMTMDLLSNVAGKAVRGLPLSWGQMLWSD